MGKKLTTEEFIARAIEIHGDRYGYDKVEYVNRKTPVWIYCKRHGYFQQKPSNHLYKRGCQKCADELQKQRRVPPPITEEEFLRRSREKHGDVYDYSEVEFKGTKTPVKIICERHGPFYQSPHQHMRGNACPSCYNERRGNTNKITQEEYIRRAKERHGDFYDYSKTVYKGNKEKVTITCPIHSDFTIRAEGHINESGYGCPACGNEMKAYGLRGFYGTTQPSHFYYMKMKSADMEWLKVGLSRNPKERRNEFLRGIPCIQSVGFLGIWTGPAVTLYDNVERPTLYHSGIPRLEVEDWSWAGYTECFDISYKNQLEEFLTTTLTPLQGVERIL